MKPKLIEPQGEIEKPTTVVADFTILLSVIDRSSEQKISHKT